ncbi:MAG: patatin-like phospholipase family protein [Bacteroidales bacterium]|nr:patatin-like phospholipase family protein [Bacteroidales bacterium]
MKYRFASLLLLFVFLYGQFVPARAVEKYTLPKHDRPTVAVVLAGGGAKGVAHVPALKAIEDAGIPIDLVVGTSIGSIIGGFYCTGYSPDTMTQIIKGTDWVKLITDNPDYMIKKTLTNKKDEESYLLRYLLDPSRRASGTRMGGILGGTNVMRFFRHLTRFLPDTLHFEDMPVPFACVGTEAINGQKKVFTYGNLPTCIRASMAIPTAFTPVTIDSVVYVDGGVVDNFPVDVARELGADIVIGVDLVVNMTNEQLTNSAIDMLMNCVDFYSREQYKQNKANSDVYIPIDVTGYSAASFGATALDTLMQRGEYYVGLKKASLDSLAKTLNLKEAPKRIRVGEYSFANAGKDGGSWTNESPDVSLSKVNDGSLYSSINLGARFDNSEFASVKVRLNYVLSHKYATLFRLQTRLGDRFDISGDVSMKTIGKQRLGMSLKFRRHDLKFLYGTKKAVDCELRQSGANLYLSQEWRSIQFLFGLSYNRYGYRDILVDSKFVEYLPKDRYKERHFSYYFSGEINSLNSQIFPTRGQQMVLNVDLITDNLATYKDKTMLPIVSFRWMAALPFSTRLTLQPRMYVRAIFKEESADKPFALFNFLGGFMNEMHFRQQKVMAGLYDKEMISEDGLGLAGTEVQYMIFRNHYIKVAGDLMSHTNNIKYAFNHDALNWGVEASYSYKTPVGPLSAKVYWNDISDKFKFFVSGGYYF